MDIHLRYRPSTLNEIVGQKHILKVLKKLFQEPIEKFPHTFLFVGETGLGKTTLARIIASHLECDPSNVIEVDCASDRGLDQVKDLKEVIRYRGFTGNGIKCVILDEVHQFTDAAWKALFKPTEEPPEHVYYCLCTTEGNKVPDDIKGRCYGGGFTLKSVNNDDLIDLIEDIGQKEGIKLKSAILDLVAKEAKGRPRFALQYLVKCRDCETIEEARDLMDSPEGNPDAIDLCRLLASHNPDSKTAFALLRKLKTIPAESTRIYICNYLAACVLNSKTSNDAARFLRLLDIFSEPTYRQTAFPKLTLQVGTAILGE